MTFFSWNTIKVLLICSGVVLFGGYVLYLNQDKLLYMPNPPGFPPVPDKNPRGFRSPKEWKGRVSKKFTFEDRMITTIDGEKIHTWLILHENSANVPTIIYFHGNAGNMGFRLRNAMDMFSECGANVLMVDYRGYGKSTGSPTEKGINLDGDAAVEHVLNHPLLQGSPIVCFGRSLGGSVAISLADAWSDKVQAIVIENTYTSVSDMVDWLMPILTPFKKYLLAINWDSDVKIQRLAQPILFISGDSDELVPTSQMVKLHQLANKSRLPVFFSVRGGTHNDTWERAGPLYYQRLRDFLVKAFGEFDTTSKMSLPNSGSDDDFVKISELDVCVEEERPSIALPTMDSNFRVN